MLLFSLQCMREVECGYWPHIHWSKKWIALTLWLQSRMILLLICWYRYWFAPVCLYVAPKYLQVEFVCTTERIFSVKFTYIIFSSYFYAENTPKYSYTLEKITSNFYRAKPNWLITVSACFTKQIHWFLWKLTLVWVNVFWSWCYCIEKKNLENHPNVDKILSFKDFSRNLFKIHAAKNLKNCSMID